MADFLQNQLPRDYDENEPFQMAIELVERVLQSENLGGIAFAEHDRQKKVRTKFVVPSRRERARVVEDLADLPQIKVRELEEGTYGCTAMNVEGKMISISKELYDAAKQIEGKKKKRALALVLSATILHELARCLRHRKFQKHACGGDVDSKTPTKGILKGESGDFVERTLFGGMLSLKDNDFENPTVMMIISPKRKRGIELEDKVFKILFKDDFWDEEPSLDDLNLARISKTKGKKLKEANTTRNSGSYYDKSGHLIKI